MKQQEEYKGIYTQLPANVAINTTPSGKPVMTEGDYMGNSSTNYLHTEENSQFFTSLEMILNNLNSWVINFNNVNPSVKADLDYLKQGIKNTIDKGYVLTLEDKRKTECRELTEEEFKQAIEKMNNSPWTFMEKPKIALCVPLQLCPMCLGEGQIPTLSTTTNCHQLCPICKGSRMIPMHVLNDQ